MRTASVSLTWWLSSGVGLICHAMCRNLSSGSLLLALAGASGGSDACGSRHQFGLAKPKPGGMRAHVAPRNII